MDDATTQWRFARAYESDAVDSDEMASALKRYDNLDSDERAEFDEYLTRNRDGAIDFAGRADSDTFDSTIGACGVPGISALGSPPGLHSERYYSIAAPSASLALSGGDCLPDELGLSDREKSKYLSALNAESDVNDGPITTADELEVIVRGEGGIVCR